MPRWDRTKQGVRLDAYGKPMSAEKARWYRQQEDRQREDQKRLAAQPKQQLRRKSQQMTTNKKPLGHDPSENAFEAKARRQNRLKIAEAVAWKLLETGQITEKEARLIGQGIMKNAQADMDTETWVKLRESPQWDAYESSMRRTPERVDSRTHEAGQDSAARKLMSKVLSQAWMDGKISDAEYRGEIHKYVTVEDVDNNPDTTLIMAAVNVLEPDANSPSNVKYEAPPRRQLPEVATEADMRYTAADDRVRGPSARERWRAAKDAERATAAYDAKKAEKELAEAKHSNRALDEVEQAASTAQLEVTQARFDAAYPSGNDEGGAA